MYDICYRYTVRGEAISQVNKITPEICKLAFLRSSLVSMKDCDCNNFVKLEICADVQPIKVYTIPLTAFWSLDGEPIR
jgi:hypothetical protein